MQESQKHATAYNILHIINKSCKITITGMKKFFNLKNESVTFLYWVSGSVNICLYRHLMHDIYAMPFLHCEPFMQCHSCIACHLCNAIHALHGIYAMPFMRCMPFMQCHSCIASHLCNAIHALRAIYAMPFMHCEPIIQCQSCIASHLCNAMPSLISFSIVQLHVATAPMHLVALFHDAQHR